MRAAALVGLVAWAGFFVLGGGDPAKADWAQVLLVFAALVLMPLAIDLLTETGEADLPARLLRGAARVQPVAALALAGAALLPPGPWAALAALPWLIFTLMLAAVGVLRLRRDRWRRSLDGMCADAATLYVAIGGAWAVIDRTGWQPLHFSPEIVTLTAVHFHYAGFVLPLLAGLVQRELFFVRLAAHAAIGIVLGVPTLALGITVTQLGWGRSLETAAALWLALAGLALAILHVRLALDGRRVAMATRGLLVVAGASLFFGMVLASAYALRVGPWLDLPQMRALHGSVNAFGFALCGLIVWRRMRNSGGRPGPPV
ncbi:MAG: YndJ family transporter [Opitutaceae bacterium]|nr:YndJ family transporter [Opitutaceae bacterium]